MMKKSDVYSDGPRYEVHDPWEARIIGYFFCKEDAELFRKAFDKRRAKRERT